MQTDTRKLHTGWTLRYCSDCLPGIIQSLKATNILERRCGNCIAIHSGEKTWYDHNNKTKTLIFTLEDTTWRWDYYIKISNRDRRQFLKRLANNTDISEEKKKE